MKYLGFRPTCAEVSLGNLEFNFRRIKKIIAPGTRVMGCVKADAYGHGLIPVARRLVACGIDYLSVASLDEAIQLKNAHIRAPVLVLGIVLPGDIAPLFKYGITPTVCNKETALSLSRYASLKKKIIRIHVKVDTGMGRIGVLSKEAASFIRHVHSLRGILIEGIFTHLACADTDRGFTLRQLHSFNAVLKELDAAAIRIPLRHAANSLGCVNYPESRFNMVRPGLVLYGLKPHPCLTLALKPVLSLKTQVVFYKRVPKGYGISYGSTYRTRKESTIATLPIGYGDGYPRNLSNKAPVLIKGRRFRISGRVCMDQIMVDIGDCRVRLGETAVLIGVQGKNRVTAEELAGLSDTIPYEIVCGLGSRVPRLYK